MATSLTQSIDNRGFPFEAIRPAASWEDFHTNPEVREAFRKFRTPGTGEAMILDQNVFIERVLLGSVARKLTDEEMAAYRAPFPNATNR